MTYPLLEGSSAGDNHEVDPLGQIEGPFSHMRQVLLSVGFLCLPHPHLGFGDANAEERAREIVEKIKAEKRIVEILTGENPPRMELAA